MEEEEGRSETKTTEYADSESWANGRKRSKGR